MKEFSENIAMRYGLKEAIIAQHLWELGTRATDNNVAIKDSKLWVRASVTAIVSAHPYLSKHQVKDAIMNLRKEHVLLKREMNDSRFDRTNWYSFSEHGLKVMGGENIG